LLATASRNAQLDLWHLSTGKKKSVAKMTTGTYANALAFSSDGKRLGAAVGIFDKVKQVQIFSVEIEKMTLSIPAISGAIAFHPDNQTIVVHASATLVQLRSVNDANVVLREHKAELSSILQHIALSEDGKFLAMIVWDTLGLKDRKKKIEVLNPKTEERQLALDCSDDVSDICFNSDATLLAALGREFVELWDMKSGKMKLRITVKPFVAKVAFSPDGKLLAIASGGSKNGIISIRAISSGQESCSITTKSLTNGLIFAKNDTLVHSGSRVVTVFELSAKK
jgi:WD40 repeat protein